MLPDDRAQVEVRHDHPVARPQQDVPRLEVPVDDVVPPEEIDGPEELTGDVRARGQRERPVAQGVQERAPRHQLQHDGPATLDRGGAEELQKEGHGSA